MTGTGGTGGRATGRAATRPIAWTRRGEWVLGVVGALAVIGGIWTIAILAALLGIHQ